MTPALRPRREEVQALKKRSLTQRDHSSWKTRLPIHRWLFVSMDVGDFFALDSVTLKSTTQISNPLTPRELQRWPRVACAPVRRQSSWHELVASSAGGQ
jgi:hypothetical protein